MAFMRNFEDRKAEIIRRSRQRIRRRKQLITWTASACVLCVLVGTWMVLPRYWPGTQENLAVTPESALDQLSAQPETALAEEESANAEAPQDVLSQEPTQDIIPGEASPEAPEAEAQEQDALYTGPIYVEEMGSFGSDYPGIYLEFSNLDLETMTADVFWRNETEQTAYYSAYFAVERLVGETWVYSAPEPVAFIDESYQLDPGGENHHTYKLTGFDLSQPGSYRICANFTLAADAVYTLWADFTLIGEEQNEEMDLDDTPWGLDPCGCIVEPLEPTQ